ncbi:ATP-binding protein [Faecalicoccus acidiformans]|uniref:ATP-binding protein n=1 Tax=Faecalicoccus acidiformans TaxID=915173 RepID=UPI0025A3EDBA|nr:ATP-binding protein [Faecalicoccus acidiformans]MDM8202785.1 ATP-binding protein [Faecalicoccus acidiformans]
MISKQVGVIVEVNNDFSKVGVYSLINDSNIIWGGNLLSGIKVGAYLTINQNDIKIIATVSSEKVIDQQNTVRSEEFDNRFHKNSVNRVVELKTKGIIKNNEFKITTKYVPMIGNEVTLTTKEELRIIYGIQMNEKTITIGKTILDEYPVQIPINRFFASHIGIFGNTGSGKSNTLHKLYLELFKSEYRENILNRSNFFIIDFNGEYVKEGILGLDESHLKIIKINTRNNESTDKIKIKYDYLFDSDVLSILFDARPATQVPFLKKAVSKFLSLDKETSFSELETSLLISILKKIKGINNYDSLDNWIKAAQSSGIEENLLNPLNTMYSTYKYGEQNLRDDNYNKILSDSQLTDYGKQYLKIDDIKKNLQDKYDNSPILIKFLMFLEFQRVFEISYNSMKSDYINPLFNRIRPDIHSLNKIISITKDKNENNDYKSVNIISLVNANSEITRLIPMLLSKMIYDDQKNLASKNGINNTIHLIIDEAHNILNSQYKNIGDDWQDYRLSVFEEIIKEGRKFGFYLTLASQRPSDISPTIMSQLHNYIIHRLVNDKDLQMLENTMPTLDAFSYKTIPMLGQGEGILTGTAFKIPILVKVDKEENIRPKSDDVILTDLW